MMETSSSFIRSVAIAGCLVIPLSFSLLSEVKAGDSSEGNVTVAQCQSEWPRSSASSTCNWSYATIYDNKCRIRASCLDNNGNRTNNGDVMAELHQVSQVSNCNGYLQVGGC